MRLPPMVLRSMASLLTLTFIRSGEEAAGITVATAGKKQKQARRRQRRDC